MTLVNWLIFLFIRWLTFLWGLFSQLIILSNLCSLLTKIIYFIIRLYEMNLFMLFDWLVFYLNWFKILIFTIWMFIRKLWLLWIRNIIRLVSGIQHKQISSRVFNQKSAIIFSQFFLLDNHKIPDILYNIYNIEFLINTLLTIFKHSPKLVLSLRLVALAPT